MTDLPITLDQLRADIAEILEEDLSTIGDDDNLMDLGLDSMRAMNLASHWDETGVPLDFTDLAEAMTVRALWETLNQKQQSNAQ